MASDTPAPASQREERSEARTRELVDLLTWQLDDHNELKDGGLQNALYAWGNEFNYGTDDLGWEAVKLITGGPGNEHPQSATDTFTAGVRVLAMLREAMMSHLTAGGTYGLVWEVAHVWIVELLAAQTELNRAIEALVLDAARREER